MNTRTVRPFLCLSIAAAFAAGALLAKAPNGQLSPAAAAPASRRTIVDVRDFGAKCNCTVNPVTLAITGDDDTEAVVAAIAALPEAPNVGGAYGSGGGEVLIPALTRITKPIRITRPYVTLRGVGTFCHPTSSLPPSGLVYDPPVLKGDALTIPLQGCQLVNLGILTRPTGGAAVRTREGVTLSGVKLHAIFGGRPGGLPNANDGRGLWLDGWQSQVRVQHCYIGGYEVGIEAANVGNFGLTETQVIGNGIGVRLGLTGGTTADIYGNNNIQNNAVGGIYIIRTGMCQITGTCFEYGEAFGPGWENPFAIRIGRGTDTPTNIRVVGNNIQGNANPAAAAFVVSRVHGLRIEDNTFLAAHGDIVRNEAKDVSGMRIDNLHFYGKRGTVITDMAGVVSFRP